MLTPFGKALRLLRLDKDMKLLELAERLDITSSYLSAIETGKKLVPDGFVVKISRAMKLSAAEVKKLSAASDQTRKEVRIDKLNSEGREIVAQLARKLESGNLEQVDLEQIKKLLKSLQGDHPFHRRPGFLVSPRSKTLLWSYAAKINAIFRPEGTSAFPIVDVLEMSMPRVFRDYFLEVRSKEEMEQNEGFVPIGGASICLREDVYENACKGQPRARFTACHELGHYLMHREIGLARVRNIDEKIYRDSEWQADEFAGALLMPRSLVDGTLTRSQAAEKFQMSDAAVEHMFRKYGLNENRQLTGN
jgi:transcriptional regulator with XRE-family HTH domain